MEALVRWEHPVLGELQPASFLAAARAAGLMDAVTGSVLDLALTACRTWWDQGYPVPVSVNVSAADVHDRTLPSKVGQALRRHGLPARALVIELTEDTLMTDPGRARGVLEQLRAQGVGVSIDDYGTGYSSLAYLRQLPVDELKLDRAFIRDLPDDPVAEAIVRHTVELAHALGLRLVIEGVEDDGTLEAIRRLGGDIAQGFRMARPMPLAALLRWLDAHGPASAPYRFGVAIPQATPPILNERIVRSP
jgi:EAL domain-containing protein (putative c-di-GMP-specific phosphodiesterase class I)